MKYKMRECDDRIRFVEADLDRLKGKYIYMQKIWYLLFFLEYTVLQSRNFFVIVFYEN